MRAPAAAAAPPPEGLRERKKAKTRAAIQQHALRLFKQQSYEATTVEQIAAAAEVSPSTFFRYFPTKEDVAIYDPMDPVIFSAFEAQPPELPPLAALRAAIREVLGSMPAEEAERQRQRAQLIFQIPELRTRTVEQVVKSMDQLRYVVAKRVGRDADGMEVRAFVGAVLGVSLMVMHPPRKAHVTDFVEALDAMFAQLEKGILDFPRRRA